MLTEKDYCDKDLSLALKEAGYIGQGRCYYDLDKEPNKLRHFGIQVLTTRSAEALNFVLAVHLYDAQKWLRNTHNLHISTKPYPCEDGLMWMYEIRRFTPYLVCVIKNKTGFREAEEALSEGIKEEVKILKEDGKAN